MREDWGHLRCALRWEGTRADKGWAMKRALRSSSDVLHASGALEGRRNFPFAKRKSYFLFVISAYSVKWINSFHNNIDKQKGDKLYIT